MSLNRLLSKKRLTVLGLNSGTSADGLDMAVLNISRINNQLRIKYWGASSCRYTAEMRRLVLSVADSKATSLEEIVYLDNLLGLFFARSAAAYLKRLKKNNIEIDVTASHGQTVRHLPKKVKLLGRLVHGTCQLGSADRIAAATGKMVVSDFRQADVALGNEGAPITVAAMRALFGSKREPRLIVNIGGMSNFFYFPRSASVGAEAADCGPGNSLSDLLSATLYSTRYDRNGRMAAAGSISERMLSLLLAAPFYSGQQVSTGRELFGERMARTIIRLGRRFKLSSEDMMATVAELTTRSIAIKVWPLVRRDRDLKKLYLTGGGRHNIFFLKRLSHHLPDLKICMVDELGIDGDYVEAAAYAVMAEACLRSEGLPTVFRAGRGSPIRPVLGKITQPPVNRK